MLVGFQERFLHHVFGVFAILGDVLRQPEDLAFIAAQPAFQMQKCRLILRRRQANLRRLSLPARVAACAAVKGFSFDALIGEQLG